MKEYNILQIANFADNGGYYDLQRHKTTVVYNEQTYTYIATGLVRDVFISPDGLTVLKVPKRFDTWGFEHNRLEVECYNEAPDWCKKHIAISELTPEGYVIQEYLDINCDAGNYYRELGFRKDGTCVIFDCDIFLDSYFDKDEEGFKYQEVFSKSKVFKDAYVEANEIPKRKIREQRVNRIKYFPDIDFNNPVKRNDVNPWFKIINVNDKPTLFINNVEILEQIAIDCGFI